MPVEQRVDGNHTFVHIIQRPRGGFPEKKVNGSKIRGLFKISL